MAEWIMAIAMWCSVNSASSSSWVPHIKIREEKVKCQKEILACLQVESNGNAKITPGYKWECFK